MFCYHSKQYVDRAFLFKTAILGKPMLAKFYNKLLPFAVIEGPLPCSHQLSIGLTVSHMYQYVTHPRSLSKF
jgi:hypothetical protein